MSAKPLTSSYSTWAYLNTHTCDCAIRGPEKEVDFPSPRAFCDYGFSSIDLLPFTLALTLFFRFELIKSVGVMFGHKQPDKTTTYHGGFESPEVEPVVDENFRQEIDPDSGVKRGLKNRHLSMMALAGIIGPGLLVGSGGALGNGGPASLLIGFGVIGIIAFSIMQSLGEVTTLYPGGGAFVSLAERFVDKGFAVAVGWVSATPR